MDNLLQRMTLEEKIGQLEQANFGKDPDKQLTDKLKRGEISSFLDGSAAIESPVMRNKLQHIAIGCHETGSASHDFRT